VQNGDLVQTALTICDRPME